jgi:GNAT superfamily N-acetyltransferase
MDKIALAMKLQRLALSLDRRCQPEGFVQKQFDGSPFGACYVTIDPDRQGLFASGNYNRVYICGTGPGLEHGGLEQLIELFTSNGVKRFFVWLSPGPEMDGARRLLGDRGLCRIRRTGYPTLCRENRAPAPFKTELDVREVSPREVAAARDQLGDTMWPEYARSAGTDGFFHYMAFDRDRPVAIAALCTFESLGYLAMASTVESHRQSGAQQALIAKRIEKAEAVGCTIMVSETLYMLQHSYRNLQWAGFQEIYEKEVYEWNS